MPDRRLFTGSGARSAVLALYADLPLCACLNWVADVLCGAGRVFKGDVGGGAHLPGGLLRGWPGLPPRAAGVTGFVGEAIGRAACVCRCDGLGFRCWVGGGVRRCWRRLGVTSRRRVAAMKGWCRPGGVFDGLVAGWLGDVGGPDDGVGSELRDERGRQATACGWWDLGGGRSSGAEPGATAGQASPVMLVSRPGSSGRAARQAPSAVPWPSRV
jgi:hypothetical protein